MAQLDLEGFYFISWANGLAPGHEAEVWWTVADVNAVYASSVWPVDGGEEIAVVRTSYRVEFRDDSAITEYHIRLRNIGTTANRVIMLNLVTVSA